MSYKNIKKELKKIIILYSIYKMDKILSQAYKVNDIDVIEKTIEEVNEDKEMNLVINEIKKPFNPILEEYAKKYKPEELTADGIPNIETQLREIREKDEEQLKNYEEDNIKRYNREMVQRVKCLSLLKMGKSAITNTFEMSVKDRNKLQDIMWSYNDIDHKDIIDEFNEKICDEIFENDKIDISRLPIYEFK